MCRAQGQLVATGVGELRPVATATAPSDGGQAVQALAGASVQPRPRPQDSAPPPATFAPPDVAGWFGWFGGLSSPAVAASQGLDAPSDGLWLAILAGVGLLAVAALAARAVHVPIGGQAARDRLRSVRGSTRAARSELGEALPLLILLLAGIAIALWILTTR